MRVVMTNQRAARLANPDSAACPRERRVRAPAVQADRGKYLCERARTFSLFRDRIIYGRLEIPEEEATVAGIPGQGD